MAKMCRLVLGDRGTILSTLFPKLHPLNLQVFPNLDLATILPSHPPTSGRMWTWQPYYLNRET